MQVVQYLRSDAVGVPVAFLSPINESTWSWQDQTQEANRYEMEEVKAVYRAVARALEEAGLEDRVEVDGAEVVEYLAALDDPYKIEFDGRVYDGGMNQSGPDPLGGGGALQELHRRASGRSRAASRTG